MKFLSTTFLNLFFVASISGQIPVSSDVNDQLLQGPCYIFATVAAIESKAMEIDGINDIDLYEWNLYSSGVLGGRSGNGQNMVEKVLQHAAEYGIYPSSSNPVPTSIFQLPNQNDPIVPGIAAFTGCISDFSAGQITYAYVGNPEASCLDDDNVSFETNDISGTKYLYSHDSEMGYVHDTSPNVTEMKAHIDSGKGLICFFTNWNGTGISHAVFVYGYSGSNWLYKDSWPGDAGLKNTELSMENCTDYYYLTGSVFPEIASQCEGNIDGNQIISGSSYYELENTSQYATNISWSVSDNLSIETQNGYGVTIVPTDCYTGTSTITCSYQELGNTCEKDMEVTIESGSLQPESILVLSSVWTNNTTCTNSLLELEVIDSNPSFITTYDWDIQGASILIQGNSTLIVRTPNSPSFLTFKVRAQREDCTFSDWKTLYGYSENCNQGGGGGAPLLANTSNVSFFEESILKFGNDGLYYEVISLDGKTTKESLISSNQKVDLSLFKKQTVLLRLKDKNGRLLLNQKAYIE